MRGGGRRQDGPFSYVDLEARVPMNHPLRPMRAMLDEALASPNAGFEGAYATFGRPSIAPDYLLRALLLQVLYSLPGERLRVAKLDHNLLFRSAG